jgi:hypothetical protein
MESPRSSLVSSTKLVTPRKAGWRFVLYPEAAEGGGAFHSAAEPRHGVSAEAWDSRSDAARRAKGKVRRYCAANRLNRLGTLTYAGTGCYDPAELRDDLADFFRKLRAEVGKPFPYLWVPEWHPKGHGLHVHFAVGRWIPYGDIKRAWGRGRSDIKLLGDLPVGSGTLGEARLAARYLAKYVGKDLAAGGQPSGLHRYEVAQGFQPRGVPIDGLSAGEVLDWAEVFMDAPPEQVWRSDDVKDWAGPPAVWAEWQSAARCRPRRCGHGLSGRVRRRICRCV